MCFKLTWCSSLASAAWSLEPHPAMDALSGETPTTRKDSSARSDSSTSGSSAEPVHPPSFRLMLRCREGTPNDEVIHQHFESASGGGAHHCC